MHQSVVRTQVAQNIQFQLKLQKYKSFLTIQNRYQNYRSSFLMDVEGLKQKKCISKSSIKFFPITIL
jgi:hypothetical protein